MTNDLPGSGGGDLPSPDCLGELRSALEKATPGPWIIYSEPEVGMPATLFSVRDDRLGGPKEPIEPLSYTDQHVVMLLRNNADQLLRDAAIGQLVREGGEEVVDKVARAIMSSGGCGLTIEGERAFCDDQRAPEGVRTYCDCHAQARATLAKINQMLEQG